ncbi:hypothetical protein ACQ4PT_064153 [Festuca glaucescens]
MSQLVSVAADAYAITYTWRKYRSTTRSASKKNFMAASSAASRRSMEERWGLAGTTALVTGGSKGIGHAIVEELAALGARVHTCSRNTVELEACRQGWEEKNLHVTVSVCDVSVRADREKLMDTVRRAFGGKLDVLVNNAGQSMVKAATECTGEDYARIMATNLESCFHLAQLADPLLLSGGRGGGGGGGGSVVHISSIAGFVGFAGLAVYSMTKGAMNQLTRSLAAEWAGDGIRVNCVAPGGINTDIAKDVETMDPEMVNS